MPVNDRPRLWVWKAWKYGLWAVVVVCTWLSGLQTAILIYRVLPLGLLWGARCIPVFYRTGGFVMKKPKTLVSSAPFKDRGPSLKHQQLGEGKSLVVAICMASVTAGSSGAYYCNSDDSPCSHETLRARSFQLACLYQFFRETTCDVRDIKEDAVEGLATLPVMLGKKNTLLFMTLLGLVLDALLTRSVAITSNNAIIIRHTQLAYSSLRIGSTMAAYYMILRYPRDSHRAWGIMSLFGLVPVMFAQAALRD